MSVLSALLVIHGNADGIFGRWVAWHLTPYSSRLISVLSPERGAPGLAGTDVERGNDKGCLVATCEGRHKAHGYCQRHYNRWRTNPDPSYVRGEIPVSAAAPRFCERCGADRTSPRSPYFAPVNAQTSSERRPSCAERVRFTTARQSSQPRAFAGSTTGANHYEANSEELSAKQRARYSENREALLAQKRDYYQRHRPRIRSRAAIWREANRDLHNVRGRSYSARNKDIRRRKQAIYRGVFRGGFR